MGASLSNSVQVNVPSVVSIFAVSGAPAGPGTPLVASSSVNFPLAGSSSSARAGVEVDADSASARAGASRKRTDAGSEGMRILRSGSGELVATITTKSPVVDAAMTLAPGRGRSLSSWWLGPDQPGHVVRRQL